MNRWDPIRDLFSVHERMNRLFEDALANGLSGEALKSLGVWSPSVDICETEHEFLVQAEVPAVKKSDIDVRMRGNTLTIEGERKPQSARNEGYHRIERAYGRFQRSFPLPGHVDQAGITATLRDGILKIVVPKKGEPLKKQIEITGT